MPHLFPRCLTFSLVALFLPFCLTFPPCQAFSFLSHFPFLPYPFLLVSPMPFSITWVQPWSIQPCMVYVLHQHPPSSTHPIQQSSKPCSPRQLAMHATLSGMHPASTIPAIPCNPRRRSTGNWPSSHSWQSSRGPWCGWACLRAWSSVLRQVCRRSRRILLRKKVVGT